jgi:hypothetical protein
MRLSTRVRILTAMLVCLAVSMPAGIATATAPPAQDNVFETWVIHLTGDSGADQGRVWLRETPCEQGFFFMLVAPKDMPAADHAVVSIGGEELVTVPAERLGFAIVLDEWPAEGFGDPSPAYVGWGADDPSPELVYAALRSGGLTVDVYGALGEPLLSGTVR